MIPPERRKLQWKGMNINREITMGKSFNIFFSKNIHIKNVQMTLWIKCKIAIRSFPFIVQICGMWVDQSYGSSYKCTQVSNVIIRLHVLRHLHIWILSIRLLMHVIDWHENWQLLKKNPLDWMKNCTWVFFMFIR